MNKAIVIIMVTLTTLFLSGCATDAAELKSANDRIIALEQQISEMDAVLNATGPSTDASLLSEASKIVELLSMQDFETLSTYITPNDNLRFSPYQHVNKSADITLTPSDVAEFASIPVTAWGHYDGTGEVINLTGIEYFNKFIYDQDFVNAPYIGQNTILSSGNTINNISEVYPNDAYIEFYFDGFNPDYSGMDWRSLTLVMRNIEEKWYLVGLIHGQWTI